MPRHLVEIIVATIDTWYPSLETVNTTEAVLVLEIRSRKDYIVDRVPLEVAYERADRVLGLEAYRVRRLVLVRGCVWGGIFPCTGGALFLPLPPRGWAQRFPAVGSVVSWVLSEGRPRRSRDQMSLRSPAIDRER